MPDILYSACFFHLVKARLSSILSSHTEVAPIERHVEASSPKAFQQSCNRAGNRESCPKPMDQRMRWLKMHVLITPPPHRGNKA